MNTSRPPALSASLRPALVLFLLLSVLTGVVYPLIVTGLAQLLFPAQAGGSLIVHQGQARGSRLIGQSFSDPGHFWGRPSATTPQPYNATASGGSNLGPLNPALTDAVKARIAALRAADPNNSAPVPIDLVTASGSGLDVAQVRALIATHTKGSVAGVIGEPRINVLELNLALDALK